MALPATRSAITHLELVRLLLQELDERRVAVRGALDAALMHVVSSRAELASLDARHDALLADICAQQSLLMRSIMGAFPVELLRAIFLELTTAQEDGLVTADLYYAYNFNRACTPFYLAAVSSRWRQVALHTPELWTYIGVPNIVNATRRQALGYYRCVKLALKRSQRSSPLVPGHPLYVVLPWDDEAASWNDSEYYQKILDAVGRHAHRWAWIDASFPKGFGPKQATVFLRSTPLLERVSFMQHNDDSMFPWSESSPAYFPDCPQLQYFDAEPLFFRPTTALPRLASLTIAIATTGVSFDVVWGILRLTPHLSTLHISFDLSNIGHTQLPTPPIALPNVACLTVYGYEATFYAWAAGVSLPGVSTLRCSTSFGVQPAHPFFANITAVVIDSDTETRPISADKPRELRQLVRLRTLTIRRSDSIQGSFFRAARSPNECWKDLSNIIFDDVGLTDDAARELIEFLRTREAHGASSLSVHIGPCDIPSWLEVELRRILGDRCYIHPQTSHPLDSSDTESDDSNQQENDE